ncbi:putative molybdenum carrier protein [Ruegeria meonggei]|nr:putative molybdenum carrier protein [Ruegeria meonggei]
MSMKIVSGGQTGVDIAALEFARENGLPYGGWVPKGRTNEAGRIPDRFSGLVETPTESVSERTKRNVVFADATLIFIDGSTSPGTLQTVDFAIDAGKPHLIVDLRGGTDTCAQQVRVWLASTPIEVLNIAGPRASEAPGVGARARAVLDQISDRLSG